MGVTDELQDFAIVVGVNYPDGSLSGLMGTRDDAVAFIEWLKSPTGGNVPLDNIRDVLSPATAQSSARDAKPIQDEIDDALEHMGVGLSKRPAGRRLYFYFAGHGFGNDADDICMLMAHATRRKLNRNMGLRQYRNWFQEHSYFQEVVFVLDCCRDPDLPKLDSVPQAPTWTVEVDDPRQTVGDLVIFAAANGMKSHEITDPKTGKRRGLFTLALLEVLSGNVGVNDKRQHTGSNLLDNLDARMKALAGANGGTIAAQRAMIELRDNLRTGLVLATVAAASDVPVRIIAPDGAKGDFVVLEGTTIEVARRPAAEAAAAAAPWLVDLDPTKSFSVRHEKSVASPPLFAVIDWAHLNATKKDGDYVFVFPDA